MVIDAARERVINSRRAHVWVNSAFIQGISVLESSYDDEWQDDDGDRVKGVKKGDGCEHDVQKEADHYDDRIGKYSYKIFH